MRAPASILGILICASLAVADPAPETRATESRRTDTLAFRIDEGRNLNSFLREGPVAAHLLLRSGGDPRILVAFPAGNSGIGLWFGPGQPVTWSLVGEPRAIRIADGKNRPLHGIEFEVLTKLEELRPRAAVLSSVRVLRDVELRIDAPDEVKVEPRLAGAALTWSRDRLDGAPGYRLVVEAMAGTRWTPERWLRAPRGASMRLRIRALTGETPLVPLASPVTADAASDQRSRDVLAFLSYEDKFLAGSWRFDTYFGRDTLISALLLAPVLEPRAMEAALISVLDRLDPHGEVAHEEDIGEFAVLRNAREGRGRVATPIYDYGMVDDDFLLAPLAARWLLDDERGRSRARAFLSSAGTGGETRGRLLARNIRWVVERSADFARDPRREHLVSIKSGRKTGNWRDSEQGLGQGRYAYDVNAVLVPAALDAAARLEASGLLEDFLDDGDRQSLARSADQAKVWFERAPRYFRVMLSPQEVHTQVEAYARELGVGGAPALQSVARRPLAFNALSLTESGAPVPILHSDEGFRLLLTEPPPEELELCIDAIFRPFPAGLMTEAGLLVANPAFASSAIRKEFSRHAYHGTVVWSWQQALMAAGLERQLRRTDLPAQVRARLEDARSRLWAVIDGTRALRTSELWSWTYARGRFRAEPFGRRGADADESNAAQLWSTVYLGLRPPGARLRTGTAPGD